MAIEDQDFPIWSGDKLLLGITILNDDGAKPSFSAPTAVWTMATVAEPTEAQVKIRKTTAGGTISLSESTDSWDAVVTILPDDTESLRPGTYFHALRVWDGSDSFTTTTGKVTLKGSIPAAP